jgi:membrane associated rhomboid family serine protease
MSDNPHLPQSPLNPLPPVVWALVLPMVLLEAILELADAGLIGGAGGVGWRMEVLSRMVFLPDQLMWMWDSQRFPLQELVRILTYSFVHLSLMHAAFVVVFTLALGKFVGEIFHPFALVALFLGSAVIAALVYTLMAGQFSFLRAGQGQMVPLVGGYPGAFGLIGAFTFVLWVRLGQQGGESWRAFNLIGLMMLVRLFFGIFFGTSPDWVADIAGFAAGFLLSFVLVPGGPGKLIAYLRAR